MTNEVVITPFTQFKSVNRLRAACILNVSRNSVTKTLSRELPYADKIYQSPIKATRRLGYIARYMSEHEDLQAFVISKGNTKLGVATRQIWSVDQKEPNSQEISYWLREQQTIDSAVDLGVSVVGQLLKICDTRPELSVISLTLPDDPIKPNVLEQHEFIKVNQPQSYPEFEDGVIEPRQFWIK